jgi:hypothetical protein
LFLNLNPLIAGIPKQGKPFFLFLRIQFRLLHHLLDNGAVIADDSAALRHVLIESSEGRRRLAERNYASRRKKQH